MATRRHVLLPVLLLALATVLLPSAPASAARLPSKAQWQRDVAVVMAPSIRYLERRVARAGAGGARRLAVVLDIDNTSLATHYAWPQAVRPTLRFAQRAHELGVKVIFVTGRQQGDATRQRPKLRRAGYTVDGICGRQSGEGLVHSKVRCRTRIAERRGLTIIASVGNRRTDFTGPYVERKFDLPDYGGRLS